MAGFLSRLTTWACPETRVAIVDGKVDGQRRSGVFQIPFATMGWVLRKQLSGGRGYGLSRAIEGYWSGGAPAAWDVRCRDQRSQPERSLKA